MVSQIISNMILAQIFLMLVSAMKLKEREFKFLQISDFHYDPEYSTKKPNDYCHTNKYSLFENNALPEMNGLAVSNVRTPTFFGNPGSQCDSPVTLINAVFTYLTNFPKVDAVFWTGDSSRHNRDAAHPKRRKEVNKQVEFISQKMQSCFNGTVVLPSIGNWDTQVVNTSGQKDYKVLFDLWKPFWDPLSQLLIQETFLKGGYYMYSFDRLNVLSINTLLWFIENDLGNCNAPSHNSTSTHPGDVQLNWMEKEFQRAVEMGSEVILIGHVPPVTTDGVPLYRSNCYGTYNGLILKYHDVIITQYFGHVNKDLAYILTTKTASSKKQLVENNVKKTSLISNQHKQLKQKYLIIPLNKKSVQKDIFISNQFESVFYTGPSIVPHSNPSFRYGVLKIDTKWFLDQHQQYYVDLLKMNTKKFPFEFQKICSTKDLGLKSLKTLDWKQFVEDKKLNKLEKYMTCSISNFGVMENDLMNLFIGVGVVVGAALIVGSWIYYQNFMRNQNWYIPLEQ
jgi:endopolyphosphatase